MSDYISKKRVYEILSDLMTESGKETKIMMSDAKEQIYEEPSADVEPVVRCKDCKWYDSERHDCPYMEEVLDDDYCSYGELIRI